MVQHERYAHHILKNHDLKHCFSDFDAPTNVYWYSTNLGFISAVKFNFKFVYFYNKHLLYNIFRVLIWAAIHTYLSLKVAPVGALFH
jgi:hypothetical protein